MLSPSPYERHFDASVIIVVYKQEDILRLTLESLKNQRTAARFEVIVTDDGSPTIWPTVQLAMSDSRVNCRYVWQQDRQFRAGQARNNAIRLSNGQVLIFLDGDCIPPADFVQRHLDAHAGTDRLIVAGGRSFYNADNIRRWLSSEPPLEEVVEFLTEHAWVNTDEELYRQRWLTTDGPWKAGFSYNESVTYSPELYFDENLVGWGIEDWEFNYRNWKSGYTFQYRPEITVWHLNLSELIGNVFRLSDHDGLVRFAKNTLYFLDKYPEEASLVECSLAFRCYQLNSTTNRWYWNKVHEDDDPKDYRLSEGILKLRRWLAANPTA